MTFSTHVWHWVNCKSHIQDGQFATHFTWPFPGTRTVHENAQWLHHEGHCLPQWKISQQDDATGNFQSWPGLWKFHTYFHNRYIGSWRDQDKYSKYTVYMHISICLCVACCVACFVYVQNIHKLKLCNYFGRSPQLIIAYYRHLAVMSSQPPHTYMYKYIYIYIKYIYIYIY